MTPFVTAKPSNTPQPQPTAYEHLKKKGETGEYKTTQ